MFDRLCLLVLSLTIILLSGCGANPTSNTSPSNDKTVVKENKTVTKNIDDDPTFPMGQAEKDYIAKYIQVTDFKIEHKKDIQGNPVGATFKVKNTGNRTLSSVLVKVYLKDKDNKSIYEERFPLMKFVGDMPTEQFVLKPNYEYQFPEGKFMKIQNIPNSWQEGNADIKVTGIIFQD